MGRRVEERELDRAQTQQIADVAMTAFERPIEASLDEVVDLTEAAQQGRQQPPDESAISGGQGRETFRFGEGLVKRPAPVQDLRQKLKGNRTWIADGFGHGLGFSMAPDLAWVNGCDTPGALSDLTGLGGRRTQRHIHRMNSRFTVHEARPIPDARPKKPAASEPGKAKMPVEDGKTEESGGPSGPEPTRYGDWERNGICVDF